jgi:hypothetical protein
LVLVVPLSRSTPRVSGGSAFYVNLHFAMNRLLAILAMCFWICCNAKAQSSNNVSTNEVIRLRVTLLDVAFLSSYSGTLTPTDDVDPRYALTVRIDSTVPAITNLTSGAVVTFAVHSPTLFLRGGAEKGKTYEISMPRRKARNLISEKRTGQASPPKPTAVGAVSSAIAVHVASRRWLLLC